MRVYNDFTQFSSKIVIGGEINNYFQLKSWHLILFLDFCSRFLI